MDSDLDRGRADALAFLKRYKTGVLSTVSPEGKARGRVIYYVCDNEFNIYFSTLSNTRKFADLTSNPSAAFTVATEEIPQTLQIEGTTAVLTDGEKAIEGMSMLIDTLMSNVIFYWPVLKLHPGNITILKLTPQWVRWADFAFGEAKDNNLFIDIPINR